MSRDGCSSAGSTSSSNWKVGGSILVAGQLIGNMCECKIEISQRQKHNKTMDGVKFECSSRMEKVYTRTSPFTIGRLYILR